MDSIRALLVASLLVVTSAISAGEIKPMLLQDFPPGGYPELFAEAGGKLFFTTGSSSLWISDGTFIGTSKVAQILDEPAVLKGLTTVGNRVVFLAAPRGSELFSSDGTAAGTFRLTGSDLTPYTYYKDILPPAMQPSKDIAFVNGAFDYGGYGYFQLWRTDGTPEGSYSLVTSWDRISPLGALGGNLYFAVHAHDWSYELWRSDGTIQGTQPITKLFDEFEGYIEEWPDAAVNPAFDGLLYFRASGSIWRTDGTAAGTFPLPLPATATWHATDSSIYFFDSKDSNSKVYITDGSVAGSIALYESTSFIIPWQIRTASGMRNSRSGIVYFVEKMQDSDHLFRTDGTPEGTLKIGTFDICNTVAYTLGDKFLFSAKIGDAGYRLWLTDGTANGSRQVQDPQLAPPAQISVIGMSDDLIVLGADAPNGPVNMYAMGPSGSAKLLPISTEYVDGVADLGAGILATSWNDGLQPLLILPHAKEVSSIDGWGTKKIWYFTFNSTKSFFTVFASAQPYSSLFSLELVASPPLLPSDRTVLLALGQKTNNYIEVKSPRGLPPFFDVKGLPQGFFFDQSTRFLYGTATKPGVYAATITATTPAGTDSQKITFVITDGTASASTLDTDADGFPDEIEAAIGTDPADAGSTPVGGSAAAGAQLQVARFTATLQFAKSNSDAVSLSGSLPLPANFNLANQSITVSIGGIVKTFTYDADGKLPRSGDRFSLRGGAFSVSLRKGAFAMSLSDEGLIDTSSGPVTVPISVLAGGTLYTGTLNAAWTAQPGRSGRAILAR